MENYEIIKRMPTAEEIVEHRVVADSSTCFYIQDVIVNPEHQR